MSKHTLLTTLLIFLTTLLSAQGSVVGDWRTIDDETGKTKSIVRIYMNDDGSLEGKVMEILHSNHGPNPICEKCPGDRKDKPIKGMVILWGMEQASENQWKGGKILDPKNGKVYSAKLRLTDEGKLEVRGFIGFSLLGRTQVWEPSS